MNGCTALGAEAEDYFTALVTDSNILVRFTADRDCASRKPGLGTEDASGSALTCEAVADGHSDWLGLCCERQLPATTRGCSGIHSVVAGQ